MDKIEIKIMNPEDLLPTEDMMVFAARLTQRGHEISNMDELMNLYRRNHTDQTARNMAVLPHPTIQKFGIINIAITGASRRFLSQITRHQNEVKFMSASLQYSDYSSGAQFVVPYEVIKYDHEHPELAVTERIMTEKGLVDKTTGWAERQYLNSCMQSLADYKKAAEHIGHDAAAYMMPQGLRNILIMSVQPYELKHIIRQRCCNRNTLEMQYVMLRIWELLCNYPMLDDASIPCQHAVCPERNMCCGAPWPATYGPTDILQERFGLLYEREGLK